jgi:8-oxo-dGTP pyrophosphatase MutT (NUDIX family)
VAPGGGEELVDVVDENDVVIDTVRRSTMRREVLRHRAVFILIRNSAGRVLIHRRSDDKDLWPGWWDVAVGGVVAAGESYEEAAVRELREEAGIDATPERVSSGRYDDPEVSLVAQCYEVCHDGDVRPEDGEVAEFRWVTVEELRVRLATDRFLPDSLALLGERLFRG